MSGWGSEGWGTDAWGGGTAGAFALLAVTAERENVLRLRFSSTPYYSGLLDPHDASRPEYFSVNEVLGTVGLDGHAVRPVGVAHVDLVTGVHGSSRFLDVVLDRPMSPWPAAYVVTIQGLVERGTLLALDEQAPIEVPALYRELAVPTFAQPVPQRDLAANGNVDASGDYGVDEGVDNLKKRALRRVTTKPGRYAHLPTYGVGIPSYGKKLMSEARRVRLCAECERQLLLEPDVAAARVTSTVDPVKKSLVWFSFLLQPTSGAALKFSAAFDASK